jgi:hypothetical protein
MSWSIGTALGTGLWLLLEAWLSAPEPSFQRPAVGTHPVQLPARFTPGEFKIGPVCGGVRSTCHLVRGGGTEEGIADGTARHDELRMNQPETSQLLYLGHRILACNQDNLLAAPPSELAIAGQQQAVFLL